MKQKYSSTTQKNAIRSQDSEGIRELDEQEMKKVAGGYHVSQAESAAMAAKRGPVVASGGGVTSMPWVRFADGEVIVGSEN